jgi:hypothetical protein
MLVEELQGSLLLLDSDEFLGAFAAAALAGDGWPAACGGMYRVFSGLLCGGGAMLGGCGSSIEDPSRGRVDEQRGDLAVGCLVQSFVVLLIKRAWVSFTPRRVTLRIFGLCAPVHMQLET